MPTYEACSYSALCQQSHDEKSADPHFYDKVVMMRRDAKTDFELRRSRYSSLRPASGRDDDGYDEQQ